MAETSESFVKFNDVKFAYDTEEDDVARPAALENISFLVKKGEFLGVLGRNGSGKSTIARLINALLLPVEGTVVVDSIDTADEEQLWNIRSNIGMVFQNPDNQIIGTSVIEDIAFGPENLGVPREEMIERIDSALAVTGLEEYKDSEPHLLSGGQKQRVAIAGILAMQTKCIVLDEATAMLDPKGRHDVMDVVRMLNRKHGITVIHITHHMDEIVDADYAILVENGRIAASGTPKDLFSDAEKVRKAGLDLPQIAKLFDELRKEGYDVPTGVLSSEEAFEFLKTVIAENKEPQKDVN